MTRRILPLALLLVLAVGAVWLVARDPGRGAGREDRAPRREPSPAGEAAAEPALAAPAPDPVAATPAPAERAVAATPYQEELAQGTWVEGRVVFPPDVPPDERVRVVANGFSFEHGDDHSVAVGPDGGFRVAFSKRTRTGRLELDATWLYLAESVKVDLRGDLEPVVLEPRLGGAIRGRVVPPEDEPDAKERLVGSTVELTRQKQVAARSYHNVTVGKAKLDASLEFAFHGLPPEASYDLELDPEVLTSVSIDHLVVQPGATAEHVLEPQRGVTIAGTIRDGSDAFAGVAEVQVSVSTQTWTSSNRRSTASTDGAFRLEGLTPGKVELQVRADGYEDVSVDLGTLGGGDVRDGVEVVLSRGSAIRGVVLQPDGSPAAEAIVRTQAESGDDWWGFGAGQDARTDDAGAFTLTGLEPGTYRLDATFTLRTKKMVKSSLTGRERERTVSTTLRGTLTGVTTGASDLVLRVSAGERLVGTVVDDTGAPLDAFRVHHGRVVGGSGMSWVPRDRAEGFDDADGAFEIEGLEPGTWRVHASAKGHLDSDEVEVEVPGGELPPLRLARAAKVRGVVLDVAGEPLRDAVVEVRGREEGGIAAFGLRIGGQPGFGFADTTDREGRFELDDVRAGTVVLRATAEGLAASEPVELVVAPGGTAERVTLQLRAGLRLTGAVVDAAGLGLAGRKVTLSMSDPFAERTAQTDADGAFAFAGLDAGEYVVATQPTPADLAIDGVTGSEEMLAARATVQVGPRDAHVVLRPSDLAPIRLYGTVTAGGRPAEARVLVHAREGGMRNVTVDVDDDGGYAVALPEPGAYVLNVRLGSGASVSRRVDVPQAAEHRCDVDVPVGSLAGRVYGPDGPLTGAQVTAQRVRGGDGAEQWAYAHAEADHDGRYAFDLLPAETWNVTADGPANGSHGLTKDVLTDVVIAPGASVRAADLHLRAGGTIRGRIVDDDGTPVAGVRVTARDATGEVRNAFDMRGSSADGAFELGGLPPGVYHLTAVGDGLATTRATEVAVSASETASAEFVVEPGVVLLVRTHDATGAPVDAPVAVLRDGVDHAPESDWSLNLERRPGEMRYGPFPAGTYQVSAATRDLHSAERTVQLAGETEVVVELVLE